MIKITKRTKNDFYLRCNNIKIITGKACKLYVKANHHLKTIQGKFGILDFGQNNKKRPLASILAIMLRAKVELKKQGQMWMSNVKA